MLVSNERDVLGLIAVADSVRPSAGRVVKELRTIGIRKVALLSGDNQRVAESIGAQTGISEVRANLLPEDKVEAVQELVDDLKRLG